MLLLGLLLSIVRLTDGVGQMEPGLAKLYDSFGGRRLLADGMICPTGWSYNPDNTFVSPISGQNAQCSDQDSYCEGNECGDVSHLRQYFSGTPCCTEPSVEGECGAGYVEMGEAEVSVGGECESLEECRARCDGEDSCSAYACEEDMCSMNVELTYTDTCGPLCQSQIICVKNSTQPEQSGAGDRRRLSLQTPVCHSGYVDVTNGQAAWWECGRHCPGGMFWTDTSCNCACRSISVSPRVFFGPNTKHALSAGNYWPPWKFRFPMPPVTVMCDDWMAFEVSTADWEPQITVPYSDQDCVSTYFYAPFPISDFGYDGSENVRGDQCCLWHWKDAAATTPAITCNPCAIQSSSGYDPLTNLLDDVGSVVGGIGGALFG